MKPGSILKHTGLTSPWPRRTWDDPRRPDAGPILYIVLQINPPQLIKLYDPRDGKIKREYPGHLRKYYQEIA